MIRRAKRVTFRMTAAEEDQFEELRGYRGCWTDTNIILRALAAFHAEMMTEKLAQEEEEKAAAEAEAKVAAKKKPSPKKGRKR